MSSKNRMLLSVMMFLQFFLWGSWYVTGPNYLSTIGFKAGDFGTMYSVGPIAGMIAPFFVGMIADRFFPAQMVMGVMHLLGAAFMYYATTLMGAANPSPSAINTMFFAHMMTYYPTLALTNTIAMKCMTNPEKEFPGIRVLGTIGWIAAGLALSWLKADTSINMFHLTIGSGVVLGLMSFALPHTPPTASSPVSIGQILGVDAFKLLFTNTSYLIFMAASTLICIPLAFYYMITSRIVEMGGLPIGQTMSYGQMSEIFFMLVMPFFFARLGVKWMLAVGMLAWVTRYGLFAVGAPDEIAWMITTGILLHGICYDFFFVTGQIYTDQVAPKEIRAQAQGMLVLFTLGLGMFVGAQVAGKIEGQHTTDASKAQAVIVKAKAEEAGKLSEALAKADAAAKPALEASLKKVNEEKAAARKAELKAIEWKPLWGKPAIFAGIIMLVFLALFRNPAPVNAEPPKV